MRVAIVIILMSGLVSCIRKTPQSAEPSRAQLVDPERAKREKLLDALLLDVLTNPNLRATRNFYGSADDKRIALVSEKGYGVPWPEGYKPVLPEGWVVEPMETNVQVRLKQRRLLGVRIDRLLDIGMPPATRESGMSSAPILLVIFNAGGNKNGPVGGACRAYYDAMQSGDRWVVVPKGWID